MAGFLAITSFPNMLAPVRSGWLGRPFHRNPIIDRQPEWADLASICFELGSDASLQF
jgi:hypothetical protein